MATTSSAEVDDNDANNNDDVGIEVLGEVNPPVLRHTTDVPSHREVATQVFIDIDRTLKMDELVQEIIKLKSKKFTYLDLISDNEKLNTATGLPSFELLEGLVLCLKKQEEEELTATNTEEGTKSKTKSKTLDLKSRIILTLIKLKQNWSFSSIAMSFNISRTTCSNYFRSTVPLLADALEAVIPWPDQGVLRLNLPLCFKEFRKTRIVLDCAETPVQKSKCVRCKMLTYSNYKKTHTLKFLVGVAPSGTITCISDSYSGRASDKFVVNDNKVLDKLDRGDAVMVDRGFMIDNECLQVKSHHL